MRAAGRLQRRQDFRAREGGLLAGQLNEDAHATPSPITISSFGGVTVTLKPTAGMRASVVRVRLFSPQDLPSVAAIVKDALRENYPMSLYLDIHRRWRHGVPR